MGIIGIWFDGKTSSSLAIELQINDAEEIIVIDLKLQSVLAQIPFRAVRISSRVGNTPRFIYFPEGKKVETRQHEIVDQWLKKYRPSFLHNLAHQLETHTYFVALTLVLVVAFAWSMFTYGVPAASRYIAYNLPQGLMNRAATETLTLLDNTQLEPSKLDDQKKAQLLKHFSSAIEQNKNLHIKVVFRKGGAIGAIGANAFALPDGTVIFTDEIVLLAKDNDELLSVLAHEIGHIKYRHALRSVIQGSVIGFAVAMTTGDVSAATNLLATFPVVMTNMSYSRDFEREADDNSLVFLDSHNIERHHFVNLMERLTYQAECRQLITKNDLKNKISSTISDGDESTYDDVDEELDLSIDESEAIFADESASEEEGEEYYDDKDIIPPFDVEAHREQCDKLMAEDKDNFFQSTLLGYFASHPETDERTKKFKPQTEPAKEHKK